jgi:hypothetical protein
VRRDIDIFGKMAGTASFAINVSTHYRDAAEQVINAIPAAKPKPMRPDMPGFPQTLAGISRSEAIGAC